MSNLEMWSLLVGFFLPLVIAAIQRASWSNPVRAAVAFVSCVVAGLGTVWLAGNFNTKDIVSSILVVLVTALATYKGLWKPSGVGPQIESATSPGTKGPVGV
jgi:hypothetical protein